MGKRCELYTYHKGLKYIFTQPNLNLRQRKYLEHIKDYDLGINYHLGKAIMVVGVWSQRSHLNQLVVEIVECSRCAKSSSSSILGLSLIWKSWRWM
jgi:hypothetical protein